MSPLRREVERLLEVGSRCGAPKTAGTCRDILKRRAALGMSICAMRIRVEPIQDCGIAVVPEVCLVPFVVRSRALCRRCRGDLRGWRRPVHPDTRCPIIEGGFSLVCHALCR